MIKVEFKKGELLNMEISGSTLEIVTDFHTVLHIVHEQLKKSGEKKAKAFKEMYLGTVEDVFLDDEQLDKKAKKLSEEIESEEKAKENQEKRMMDVLDELKDILEEMNK